MNNEDSEEAPIVFLNVNGILSPHRLGQRIMVKALERDMAIHAAQQLAAENEQLRAEKQKRAARRPQHREATQKRDTVIKQIKDAHPAWSYIQVARAATGQLEEEITEYQVREAYRRNKWKWKPSNSQ